VGEADCRCYCQLPRRDRQARYPGRTFPTWLTGMKRQANKLAASGMVTQSLLPYCLMVKRVRQTFHFRPQVPTNKGIKIMYGAVMALYLVANSSFAADGGRIASATRRHP
jgi:hypothetical protein